MTNAFTGLGVVELLKPMQSTMDRIERQQRLAILANATNHVEICERDFRFCPSNSLEPFTFGGFENDDQCLTETK